MENLHLVFQDFHHQSFPQLYIARAISKACAVLRE
jgi:hypothetical protein